MVNISSCWLLDFPASLLRPDIGCFAFSMSDLPLTLILFLMQIIAQFFMSLLNSILCDLFALYNSDSLWVFSGPFSVSYSKWE